MTAVQSPGSYNPKSYWKLMPQNRGGPTLTNVTPGGAVFRDRLFGALNT